MHSDYNFVPKSERERHTTLTPDDNEDVYEVVQQASKLEASIENSSILDLQSQTDQLQSVVSHIDLELGRLKALVRDIAEARSRSVSVSRQQSVSRQFNTSK